MDVPDLARLEHENMVEWVRLSAIQVDGSLIRVAGGIGSFLTGLPARLFNQVPRRRRRRDRGCDGGRGPDGP